MINDITLYGRQYEIFDDWLNSNKHVINIVPVGSGKSFLATLALPIFASNVRYHQNRDVVYSAPTMTMCKTIIWPSLKRTCMDVFNIPETDINNSDMTIKFPDGNYIRCKSAEQRLNLRGINASIWIADEAALYSSEVLAEISNRTRPAVGQEDSAGRIIIITTPHGDGPLKTLYDSAQQMPDKWVIHHYNYEQMASGSRDFIETQKRLLSPLKFKQDFMCSFESVEDQFYYTFNRQLHTAPLVDDGRDQLYTAHDFNKRISCAIVFRVNEPYTAKGTIEVLKAYSIPDCGTEQMAQAIRADFPKRRINSIIDMSGAQLNRDTTSPFGVTDRTLLEKYAFNIINTNVANPLISDTDNSANAFIQAGRLTINSSESNLIQSLSSYHYEDATRKKLVKYTDQNAYIDGLGDALRYAIHTLFQLQHHDTSNRAMYRGNKLPGIGTEYLPVSPLFPGGPTWQELEQSDTDNEIGYRGWN